MLNCSFGLKNILIIKRQWAKFNNNIHSVVKGMQSLQGSVLQSLLICDYLQMIYQIFAINILNFSLFLLMVKI